MCLLLRSKAICGHISTLQPISIDTSHFELSKSTVPHSPYDVGYLGCGSNPPGVVPLINFRT